MAFDLYIDSCFDFGFSPLPPPPAPFLIFLFIFSVALTLTIRFCALLIIQPTAMDAMALVHSRIQRVVYAMPSDDGAIGTRYHIHTLRSLNHRYRAYLLRPLPQLLSSEEDTGGDGTSLSTSDHIIRSLWQSLRGTTAIARNKMG